MLTEPAEEESIYGKTKDDRQESQESKEVQEGSPTNNILVGDYRVGRAERWEYIRRVSSEVGDI